MKSNKKYVFFFDLLPLSVPCCRSAKFYLNMTGCPQRSAYTLLLTKEFAFESFPVHRLCIVMLVTCHADAKTFFKKVYLFNVRY